jgi:hypothetical protein
MAAVTQVSEKHAQVYDELPVCLPSQLDVSEIDIDILAKMTIAQRSALMKKAVFLRAFASRGVMRDGCVAAGVTYSLVHTHWRRTDPWFEAMLNEALLESKDVLEAEAYRRAVQGIDEPVIFQGMVTTIIDGETGREKTLTVKKYSDGLLQMLLKASDPEKYREQSKVSVDHGGAVGVLVVPGVATDVSAWGAAAKEQQAKYAHNTGDKPAIEHKP